VVVFAPRKPAPRPAAQRNCRIGRFTPCPPPADSRASSRSARTSTSTREKPEEYRFYKGDPNNDRQPDSQEALIGAIKKCHQTLWAGGKFSPSAAFGELCEMMEDRG
jgi:hypothetical protein